MKFTGEQFIPGIAKKRLVEEHHERYLFASNYVASKVVLDIACGTGFGTKILSEKAKKVFGVDLSAQSIKYAKDNFVSENIEFIQNSVDTDLFEENYFDVICSFETIEHLEEPVRKKYLSHLNKWLKIDGLLLLSTPNKKITSPFTENPLNEFHILEYTKENLVNELSPYFLIEKILGQRKIDKFFANHVIRRIIQILQRFLNLFPGIYTTNSSPAVQQYDENKFEPRIFFLICRKTNQEKI